MVEVRRPGVEVRTATVHDARIIGETLAKAFVADPVVRWMLPHPHRDALLFRVLATHVHAAPGSAQIAFENGEPVGAALWDPPGHRRALRQQLAGNLSFVRAMRMGARRGLRLEAAFARNQPQGPYLYLAQLGAVNPGNGVGSAMLEQRLDGYEGPAYLESSHPANVPLYERFGFEVTTAFNLPEGGPPVWGMLRR
jgi:hypothetical protein